MLIWEQCCNLSPFEPKVVVTFCIGAFYLKIPLPLMTLKCIVCILLHSCDHAVRVN